MKLKAHFFERNIESGLPGDEPVVKLTFAIVGVEDGAMDAVDLKMRNEPYVIWIEDREGVVIGGTETAIGVRR